MPVNALDMLLVHRVFRRELGELAWLIDSVQPGDNSRARIVGRHLKLMTDALHHHHMAEDELVWPIVSARALDRRSDIERKVNTGRSQRCSMRCRLTAWHGRSLYNDRPLNGYGGRSPSCPNGCWPTSMTRNATHYRLSSST